MKILVALCCSLMCNVVLAGELNAQRAQFNYQMSCQGCHAPDGGGAAVVPRIRDNVGVFLTTAAGREYLVRVPGSAVSALDDAALAEVLNWIVLEFAGSSLHGEFDYFTPQEVGRLRQHPLNEVALYRAQLLAEIAGTRTRE